MSGLSESMMGQGVGDGQTRTQREGILGGGRKQDQRPGVHPETCGWSEGGECRSAVWEES